MALALFDLDETLIAGDSASLWLEYMVAQELAPADMIAEEQAMMARYHQGLLAMEQYMTFTLQPLAGKDRQWLNQQGQYFAEHTLRERIYPAGLAQIAWHRQRGDTLVLISASSEHLVSPMATILGMDHCIAIQLEEAEGKLTGQPSGTLSFRAGKVTRIHQWLAGVANPWQQSHGYSDSLNDLPLLQAVAYPHAVNPSPALRQEAEQHGWPVLNWQR